MSILYNVIYILRCFIQRLRYFIQGNMHFALFWTTSH